MAQPNTQQKLIDAGTELFLQRGYNDTGIQDILRHAGVPKGSFYHHFSSKECFGLAVVNHYAEQAAQALDETLGDSQAPALERVRLFFVEAFAEFEESDCRVGCLLGTLGQELAQSNDSFRQVIDAHLHVWAARIAECLEEAKSKGELSEACDATQMAQLLIDAFQGAALRMKLERNPDALQRFLRHYFSKSV